MSAIKTALVVHLADERDSSNVLGQFQHFLNQWQVRYELMMRNYTPSKSDPLFFDVVLGDKITDSVFV